MRIIVLLLKAIQAGERWITVHPNGPDEKGQPVLVTEQKDGSYKVVGGAGGSLNHLRLTGVKPKEAYAAAIREKAKARREDKKKQRERDKVLGLQEKKAEAHRRISEQQRSANREFVQGVASAMGWRPEDYAFDESMHADKSDHVRDDHAAGARDRDGQARRPGRRGQPATHPCRRRRAGRGRSWRGAADNRKPGRSQRPGH